MYFKMTLEDKVRVPPHRLGEDLDAVILNVLQEQLEGSIAKEIGIFIAVTKVLDIGEGELIPGDGAVYYDVRFEAVVLRLALQEVIEGEVVETTSFGAFISLGPIDAMLHVSQISDEYINYDEKNGRLICQDSLWATASGRGSSRSRSTSASPGRARSALPCGSRALGPRSGWKRNLKRRKGKERHNGRA